MHRIYPIVFSLFCALFFLFRLDAISKPYFDEPYYVGAARQMVEEGTCSNSQHPPLAKLFIAAGMLCFGDNPWGWRLPNAVLGAATLLAFFYLALLLFGSSDAAWLCVLLTLTNQLVYVQSRIATLDSPAFAFIAWALVAFLMFWKWPERSVWLMISGALFGCATACKWIGVLPLLWAAGFLLMIRYVEPKSLRLSLTEKRRKELSGWLRICFCLGVVPALLYSASFVPLFLLPHCKLHLNHFLKMQYEMFLYQQLPQAPHPYASSWITWPFELRPIWYLFEKTDSEQIQGVLLLGNPFVMWGGLIALGFSVRNWFRNGSTTAFFVSSWYLLLFLPWALLTHLTYYYYYYPSGVFLSLAWVNMVESLPATWPKRKIGIGLVAVALVFFVFYFPLLGGVSFSHEFFLSRIWFAWWS